MSRQKEIRLKLSRIKQRREERNKIRQKIYWEKFREELFGIEKYPWAFVAPPSVEPKKSWWRFWA